MICHFSSEFNDFHDAVIHVVQEIQCSEITNLHRICGCGYDRNMTWYIKCHVQYFSIIVMFSTNRSTSWFEQAGALSTIHIAVLFGTSPGFQKTKITSRGLLLSVIYIFVSTDLPHNELFFFHHKNCWWESIHGLSLGKIAVSYTTGAPSDEEEDADSPSPKKSPSNFRVTRLHGREMERSGGWDCRG